MAVSVDRLRIRGLGFSRRDGTYAYVAMGSFNSRVDFHSVGDSAFRAEADPAVKRARRQTLGRRKSGFRRLILQPASLLEERTHDLKGE